MLHQDIIIEHGYTTKIDDDHKDGKCHWQEVTLLEGMELNGLIKAVRSNPLIAQSLFVYM